MTPTARERADAKQKQQIQQRVEAGLCRQCDALPSPGRPLCEYHRLKRNEAMRKHRAKSQKFREYQNEYHASLRAEWRAAGLCAACGKPPVPGKKCCPLHSRERNKRRRERLRSAGICTSCHNRPAENGKSKCSGCLEYLKQRVKQLTVAGLCVSCGGVRGGEFGRRQKRCEMCAERIRLSCAKLKESRKEAGLCPTCGLHPPVNNANCESCTYAQAATSYFGSKKHAPDLKAIFDRQAGRCAYTGRPITVGLDAELDHIVPRTRGGKDDDINNVQWLWKVVNQMKRHYLEDEFLEAVKMIAAGSIGK